MNKKIMIYQPILRNGLKVALAAVFLWAGQASAQSMLLLDPAGDGGFENGADFSSNGWNVENYTNSNANKWFVGAASMPTAGNNAAFISEDATGATYKYDTAGKSSVMFWRDITFPQGYTAITLSFKVKVGGEKTGNRYYDALSVHFQNGATVPAITQPGTDTNQASISNSARLGTFVDEGAGYVTKTYYLDAGNAMAATTRRLIFYWKNNDSLGTQPPPSIDEISVTAALTPANDDADSAILLTLGAGCTGLPYDNIGATAGAGEPTASCRSSWQNGAVYHPVWFKFTAPASGAVRISTDYGGPLAQSGMRTALFSATDSSDYSTFNILHCAGNSGVANFAATIFYSAGLTPGETYYILMDVYYASIQGSFCITADELSSDMLSDTVGNCVDMDNMGDFSWSGTNGDYKQWMSIVDAQGKLMANVRQLSGDANTYASKATIRTGALRTDGVDGRTYMNRNYLINSNGGSTTSADVQLFFTDTELTEMGGGIASLNVTRLAGNDCSADFIDGSQKSLLTQTANGSSNGANWIQVKTPDFSNFYIHKGNTTLPVEEPGFKDRKLVVAPNPTNGLLRIKIEGAVNTNSNLQVTDMLGKVVYQAQPSGNNITIDMSNLAAGQYYIRYTDATYSKTVKIVKN